MISRVVLVSLGLVAMCAGLALGSVGCSWCQCAEVDPLQPGVFEIVASTDRPELVGGIVDASDEGVEISFTDAQGNDWVINYEVIERWP